MQRCLTVQLQYVLRGGSLTLQFQWAELAVADTFPAVAFGGQRPRISNWKAGRVFPACASTTHSTVMLATASAGANSHQKKTTMQSDGSTGTARKCCAITSRPRQIQPGRDWQPLQHTPQPPQHKRKRPAHWPAHSALTCSRRQDSCDSDAISVPSGPVSGSAAQ